MTDLLNGYKLLFESYNLNKEKSIFVKYEDIIANPEVKIHELCNYIGVDFEEEMLNSKSFDWRPASTEKTGGESCEFI